MKTVPVLIQQVNRYGRRTESIQRLTKYTLDESRHHSSNSEGSSGQLTQFQSTLGIKLRAMDPRYITHSGDYQKGNVVIPVSDVYELLRLKLELSEEVAKVWLTTSEMGFSLTVEEHMVVCPKNLREGTITDRYLPPDITRFAIKRDTTRP
jgi:ABC-type histidine transport system ATPase subunit